MFIGTRERLFKVLKGLYVEIIRHTIPSGLINTPLLTYYKHKFPSGIPGTLESRNPKFSLTHRIRHIPLTHAPRCIRLCPHHQL